MAPPRLHCTGRLVTARLSYIRLGHTYTETLSCSGKERVMTCTLGHWMFCFLKLRTSAWHETPQPSEARQPIMSCGAGTGPGLWRTLALSVSIKIGKSYLRKILKKANTRAPELRAPVRFIGLQQCTSKRHNVNQNYVFTVWIKLLS